MAETAKYRVENELGCGFVGAFFHRWSFQPRRTSAARLPSNSNHSTLKKPTIHYSKSRRSSSGERAFLDSSKSVKILPKLDEKPIAEPTLVDPRPSNSLQQNPGRRPSDATRSSTSSSNSSVLTKVSQAPDLANSRRLRREPTFTSGELSMTLFDSQQSNSSGNLYRGSSGNVMLLGHLGNLKQQGTKSSSVNNLPNTSIKALDYHHRTIMGNIVRKPSSESPKLGNIFRGWMSKLDPEELKSKGNEEYKQGRFEEALALYNKAISLDSNRASCHSNKSAALIGLGRLIDAVLACREAIRIEPSYQRAHHRLATLYLRLGEADKALDHYKQSGPKTDSKDIARAQALKTHLTGCRKARELRDWNTLLKESQYAISSAADSAPQIYAMLVEALLKLHRHQEACNTFQKGPNFDIDSCISLFDTAGGVYLLIIRAEVYMIAGRFEDAVAAAQCAAQLDANNEVNRVVRRTRAVASARSNGNQLFMASKFSEACVVYSEGLEHDLYNSILLCNRAACRSKLGQFEKAIEDCTAALSVRPSYSKARLRRADCNAKLERWEAAIQDYEVLIQETPGDEEVGRALFEVQVQCKKQRGEDIEDMKFGSNLVFISSNERFRHFVTAPGMSVVLFCNKKCHKQVLQLMEQVCKSFPSVYFLKVEIEDHPYLAKSEGLSAIPTFKIYKNGSKIKEIPGNNRELLESAVKLYSS
ncbi:hypothetical protein F0562_013152 [Nyssa sinensis]|uniref:Thioredoxin domain-containing protein n=1 Tax=Nyssa sinensis TaxID=561372 RepID=A0A5J4ZZI0_9ASTE|nr:hypothetical protein F0562_013152 [Nyssa sinensis]